MSRLEKIKKLANAIRRYRGAYHPESKKWIRAPKPKEAIHVTRWLKNLGVGTELMAKINGFKTQDEMRVWILEL